MTSLECDWEAHSGQSCPVCRVERIPPLTRVVIEADVIEPGADTAIVPLRGHFFEVVTSNEPAFFMRREVAV